MRKIFFYPKLGLNNIWRNRSTYLPYILACVVSVFTVYTIISINNNGALDNVRQAGYVKVFTLIGSVILSIFCSTMIFYTNSFLIKRRKKEIGMFSILGMEKKNIAVLMILETIFVSVISLAAGLGLGMALSQLFMWILLRLIRVSSMVEMPVSTSAVCITLLIFGVVFGLTLLYNIFQIQTSNPISLLAGAKQGEKEPKSSKIITVIGILSLAAAYIGAAVIKDPVHLIIGFFLLVLLVIIGTYCLFTSGSIALLKLMRRKKSFYYRPNNFITISGMIYRMKQNAAGLATICILSCMVLVTVSVTLSLNLGTEDALSFRYPYEYSFCMPESSDAEGFLSDVYGIAGDNNVVIENETAYRKISMTFINTPEGYTPIEDVYDNTIAMDAMADMELILLEDYNANTNSSVQLGDDEVLLLTRGDDRAGENGITIAGRTFKATKISEFGNVKAKSRSYIKSFTVVFSSEDVLAETLNAAGAESVMICDVSFDLEGKNEDKREFESGLAEYVQDNTANLDLQEYSVKESYRVEWYDMNGAFVFFGLYFSMLFILATALIIYYKQLSEGYDDGERFGILQKVGMSEGEVKATINSQILTVFFLPLLTALVHISFAFIPVSRLMMLFGIVNIPLQIAAMAIAALVYAFVYYLLFRLTSRTYFNIVRRK